MHLHRTPTSCPTCNPWPDWARHITAQLNRLEELMTDINTDQAHLDADVAAEGTALATIIAELKAQHAAGTPLDFTAADAFVAAAQGEAAADAPVVPAPVDVPPVVTP